MRKCCMTYEAANNMGQKSLFSSDIDAFWVNTATWFLFQLVMPKEKSTNHTLKQKQGNIWHYSFFIKMMSNLNKINVSK